MARKTIDSIAETSVADAWRASAQNRHRLFAPKVLMQIRSFAKIEPQFAVGTMRQMSNWTVKPLTIEIRAPLKFAKSAQS